MQADPISPKTFVQVDNVKLNVERSTVKSNGPTVVLIHGFGASLQTWFDIWPFLSTKYPVLRFDLKGSGFSSKPKDEQYSPQDQASLTLHLLEKLGITNVVLIGHSLGGGIALLTYFQSIHDTTVSVKGLVLIDSAGYPQALPFFIENLRNPLTRFVSKFFSEDYKAEYVLRKIFKNQDAITPDRVRRYSFFLNQPDANYALKQTAIQILSKDRTELVDKLSGISVPTLIIWGNEDKVIPVENALNFKRDIPTSRLCLLPETGHVPQEERPGQVFEAIRAFLEALQ